MIDDSDKPFIERMDNRFAYAWGTLNAPHNWPKLTQEQEHRRKRLMSILEATFSELRALAVEATKNQTHDTKGQP
jgi:hypothetical protein